MSVRPPVLELPHFLGAQLAAGHPWVYRDHVPKAFRAASGSIVRIQAGAFSGFALWDAGSQIALRVYSRREPPTARWVRDRVTEAWRAREPIRAERTTAYRWIFGEGDGLPGVTVDLYAGFAVVATYAEGLDRIVEWVVEALNQTSELSGVLRRHREGPTRLELLSGREPPERLVVEEHGVRLHADLRLGQKTGLFLDHRENRRFIGSLSAGREVLNLFSYTGGFSVHAALSGAIRTTSVDVAAGAIDAARDNFSLNGLDADAHELVAADVFEFLERARREGRSWDLVICDPPSFARSRQQLKQATKAYTRLNAVGMAVTRPGGLYAAASCTSQVGPELFRQTLAQSAERAKRRFQIVHDVGQPMDHPVMVAHPEGRYLKLVLGRVLELS